MAGLEFRGQWPVVDEDMTVGELKAEARERLAEWIANLGFKAVGPAVIEVQHGQPAHVLALVPVSAGAP